MKILIVAATPFEIAPLHNYLDIQFTDQGHESFIFNDLEIDILITGVGLPLAAYALGKKLQLAPYNLVINPGIAGAFNRSLAIGDVVQVVTEQFGDLGVEEADGQFTDVHTMELIGPDQFPFQEGKLLNDGASEYKFLPQVTAISVNKVHGEAESIAKVQEKYSVDIESMEGAAVAYVCLAENIPFLQIRAISNYVEPRNRDKWNIPLAIDNLNKTLIELLDSLKPENAS